MDQRSDGAILENRAGTADGVSTSLSSPSDRPLRRRNWNRLDDGGRIGLGPFRSVPAAARRRLSDPLVPAPQRSAGRQLADRGDAASNSGLSVPRQRADEPRSLVLGAQRAGQRTRDRPGPGRRGESGFGLEPGDQSPERRRVPDPLVPVQCAAGRRLGHRGRDDAKSERSVHLDRVGDARPGVLGTRGAGQRIRQCSDAIGRREPGLGLEPHGRPFPRSAWASGSRPRRRCSPVWPGEGGVGPELRSASDDVGRRLVSPRGPP